MIYVREDCFVGERLATIEQSRVRSVVWSREEAGMRRHSRTQRRFVNCDRHDHKNVIVDALVHGMRLHFDVDKQIARRPAAHARVPFAGDTDARTSGNTRRDSHFDRLHTWLDALPMAVVTRQLP